MHPDAIDRVLRKYAKGYWAGPGILSALTCEEHYRRAFARRLRLPTKYLGGLAGWVLWQKA